MGHKDISDSKVKVTHLQRKASKGKSQRVRDHLQRRIKLKSTARLVSVAQNASWKFHVLERSTSQRKLFSEKLKSSSSADSDTCIDPYCMWECSSDDSDTCHYSCSMWECGSVDSDTDDELYGIWQDSSSMSSDTDDGLYSIWDETSSSESDTDDEFVGGCGEHFMPGGGGACTIEEGVSDHAGFSSILLSTLPQKSDQPVNRYVGERKSVGTLSSLCVCCSGEHSLNSCKVFLAKALPDRRAIVINQHLCFKCLKAEHIARQCRRPLTCRICGRPHPTSLHNHEASWQGKWADSQQRNTEDVVCMFAVSDDNGMGSANDESHVYQNVVPVMICRAGTQYEVRTYAVLDGGSDVCFVSRDLCEELNFWGCQKSINLKTLHGSAVYDSTVYNDIQVSDLHGNNKLILPRTFSISSINIDGSCVPRPDTVACWPHLKQVAADMEEYMKDVPVGLILGNNCTQALEPIKVVPSSGTGVFATLTKFGWTVQGPVSMHTQSRDVTPNGAEKRQVEGMTRTGANFCEPGLVGNAETISNQACLLPEDKSLLPCEQSWMEPQAIMETNEPVLGPENFLPYGSRPVGAITQVEADQGNMVWALALPTGHAGISGCSTRTFCPFELISDVKVQENLMGRECKVTLQAFCGFVMLWSHVVVQSGGFRFKPNLSTVCITFKGQFILVSRFTAHHWPHHLHVLLMYGVSISCEGLLVLLVPKCTCVNKSRRNSVVLKG